MDIRGSFLWFCIAVAALDASAAVAAAPSSDMILVNGRRIRPFNAPSVPEAALARMRGGLMLPNGLNISIGIDIQTRVDGFLVLHTIYATDGPDAGVRVFTDGLGGPTTAPGTVTVQTGGDPAVPEVTVSRSPTGTTVDPGAPGTAATVNILSGLPSTWLTAAGQTPVPVTASGAPVATPAGNVSLSMDDRGAIVTLSGRMLEIQQLVGQATGVVVANSGNDRTIDTVSSVNVDLRGLSPELNAGLALADRLALDVATAR